VKLVRTGKTKDVYEIGDGRYLLKFKDDVTGINGVFDPGANSVGLSIEGMGRCCLRLTEYFFRLINDAGIPTHFIGADIEKAEMTVRQAKVFGKGIESICRYRATGSFIRRYGMYATENQTLDALVEITLKDDERGDPFITGDTLNMLGILTLKEYDTVRELTGKVSNLVKDVLRGKGLELYDIKLEFGCADGEIILIDEISGGSMRVYKDGAIVGPLSLVRLLLD
jgi:phosphoribosylaminoimidazole-succinocarboxamide synthase